MSDESVADIKQNEPVRETGMFGFGCVDVWESPTPPAGKQLDLSYWVLKVEMRFKIQI